MGKLKQYIIDTNLFRYAANPNGGDDLNRAAKLFWRVALHDFKNGKATLLVPDEVRRELLVQSYSLSAKETRKIMDLLLLCEVITPARFTIDIEHTLRSMGAYVRADFKKEIGRNKMEYGGVSDMRILYTAYVEDAILVTANIKDFLLYPLLFDQDEERLYDIKEQAYVSIPEDGYETIHEDPMFKAMMQDFFTLDQKLDEDLK